MADNTTLAGGDIIRDLARQAGTIKTQVMQIDAGGPTGNAEKLITAGQQTMANSLPMALASDQGPLPNPLNAAVAMTAFTTADTVVAAPVGDGTLVSGASTVGSIVSLVIPDGFIGWTLLIKNWVNGTVYTEASTNSTNGTDGDWVEVKGRRTGTAPGTESVVYAMVANGYYRGNGAGFTRIRARFVGGASFPSVAWTLSTGAGAVFLNSGIPAGTSPIGYIEGTAGALLARDGTDITTPTAMPTGGVGLRGWLSAIWTKLNGTLGVTGTFWQATQPVSNGGVFAVQSTATQSTAANLNATVTQQLLTKGSQGATGVTTQDLKDSGRVAVSITAEFSPVAITEAMMTLSVSRDGATPTTPTSYVIPTGKRLRITSIDAAVENTLGTSLQRAYFRLRFAATGGALTTSPLQLTMPVVAAGTVKSISASFNDVPDGIEFLGDNTKAIGVSLQAPDWVSAAATLKVYLTVIGFEY